MSSKISFIIPFYNAADTLSRAVASIAAQQLPCYEIIAVNDGSIDDSYEIAQRLAAENPNLAVFTQPNQGPSAARNAGIEKATGDYLTFMDCDDYLGEGFPAVFQEAVQKEADLAVYGLADDFYKEGKLIAESPAYATDAVYDSLSAFFDDLGFYFYKGIMYSNCNKIYKAALVREQQIRFPVGEDLGEDVCFNLAYYRCCNTVVFSSRILYHYVHRMDGKSLSQKYLANEMEIATRVFASILALFQEKNAYHGDNVRYLNTFFLVRSVSCVNALFHPECALTPKQKKAEIKKIIHLPLFRDAVNNHEVTGSKDKMVLFFYKHRFYTGAYAFFWLFNAAKRKCASLLYKLKK